MMKGIGIDIVEIDRVKDAVKRSGKRFLDRVFTPREIAYCRRGQAEIKYPELAARFAAKEAYAKALGTGMTKLDWKEIEVLKDARGKPLLSIKGKKSKNAQLSLSHSRDYAAAVVYVE